MEYGEARRPDPDRLLSAELKSKSRKGKGELTLFFGMAAGVGKTTAMLRAAQQRKKEGIDVVIGLLETHGRIEVMKLAEGLETIPRRMISHRGVICREMDLSAILNRKPQLALVDELPHHNAPGCRHPYRWQDVIDLLEAGIDVYTTLNVQHVESRKEMIEQITGITIRETVPDLMIERASEIQLVDVMPSELLHRLKEGRVYLGDKSVIAAQHFFQEERLAALREIALRLTAEKVDYDLIARQSTNAGWRPAEKLLMWISPTRSSQAVIRATRRFAFALKASWIAVFIDTGAVLTEGEQKQLADNLALARDLGAEVLTVVDPDRMQAIQNLVEENAISQIVVGRTEEGNFLQGFERSISCDALLQMIPSSQLHILASDEEAEELAKEEQDPLFSRLLRKLATWQMCLAALTIGAMMLLFALEQSQAAFLLLLFFLMTSFLSQSKLAFALSAFVLLGGAFISWWFFPSVQLTQGQEVLFLTVTLIAALTNAFLRHQLEIRESLLRRESEESRALYEVMHQIAIAPTQESLLQAVSSRLSKLLKGTVEILLLSEDHQLVPKVDWVVVSTEKEHAVATWVVANGKPAGWSTETLSAVEILCWPLKGGKQVIGVLAFRPKRTGPLTLEETHLIDTVTQQLALYLERIVYQEKARQSAYVARAEHFQDTIVQSVAQELTRPLHAMQDIVRNFPIHESLEARKVLFEQLKEYLDELERWLTNLSELSLMSSGFMEMHIEKVAIKEWLESVISNVEKQATGYKLVLQVPDDLPEAYFDPTLMELVMTNLLLNAFAWTQPGKQIWVTAEQAGLELILSVADEGKGIPSESIERIFEKFFRLPDSQSSGLGLGLSVAKAIVGLHQGRIEVQNRLEGGSRFTLFLPIDALATT